MEGPGDVTTGRSKGRRPTGALRVAETVAVWLAILGVFAGVGWGVSLAVRDGIARIDDAIAASHARTSVAVIAPVDGIAEEPVVAPGIGEPAAETTERRIPVVEATSPAWEVLPAPDYPVTSGTMVPGTVAMKCAVTVEGRLDLCEIVDETPEGRGFGRAALESAEHARLRPRTVDGRPVEGQVQFSVRFTPR